MRGRLLAVAVVAFLTSGAVHAQTCTSYSTIPNFRTVSYVKGVSWTFAWDPIPGTPAGYQYDVSISSGSDACTLTRTVTTVSTTTYTLQLSPNTFYQPFVQAHDDPCKSAGGGSWADTFTNVPQKPGVPKVTVGNSMVTGTIVAYADPKVSVIWLERAGTDGKYRIIAGMWNCPRYWPYPIADYGSEFGGSSNAPKLPAGVYQYRLRADNMTGLISSDPVTVTVGPPQTLAINSFNASPTSIRPGQPVTLSWVSSGANSVMIDNKVGAQSASGSATVKPTATTTYVLTAAFGSQTLTSSVTVNVLTQAIVNVTSIPSAMLQPAGSGGGTTSYALTNSGGTATAVTLTQTGGFFTQSPATFTLQPGGTQVVTITGTAQSAGPYEGTSNLAGSGVPAGLQISVKLLSAAPPNGTVTAEPSANRIDVASAAADNPTGSVSFTNHGTATLTGILTSDVPWMIPQSGVVTIAPSQTAALTFTIDRTRRPDASALIGSAEGNLSLSFLGGTGSSFAARQPHDTTPGTPSVSLVKIIDTVQSTVTTAGVPSIAAGEVALLIAGVGHVIGSRGVLFVSDVTLLNPQGSSKSVDDVKFYYTPATGSPATARSTSMPSVPGQMSIAVADVVKNLFNGGDEVGTLHIRSKDADKLSVAATVLTTNNPTGTFGNIIPVFRSDRAAASGSATVLTGLRKDGTTHTNLYVQEVGGFPATVQIDFLASDGSTISSRPADSIDTFKLLQLVNVVPAGAVTAVIANTSTAGGKIAAYATPVDEVSSDTWAIVDWSRQSGYAPTEATVIPIAGSLHGANKTFYRTDLAITNRGTSSASGTLRYIARNGDTLDRQISLGAKQSEIIADVVGSRFNVVGDSVGYMTFTPVTGSFAITSRTFTTVGGKPDTFGTGVPALAAAGSLKTGGSRPIAGLADSTRSAVVAGRAGTFRTNFALMETTGNSVTIRVTFRFTFPAGQKAQGIGSASRDYMLNGNQFLMLNSIAGEILGVARLQYGDLSNVQADFQVLDGSGAVELFTSSVENATGDSILRTQ